MQGYKLHRLDRLHKKGGGVCAYTRKDIKYLKRSQLYLRNKFPSAMDKTAAQKIKITVGLCLIPTPLGSLLYCFEKYFKPNYGQALTMGKLIIFLGDLNCDMLKPTPGSAAFCMKEVQPHRNNTGK